MPQIMIIYSHRDEKWKDFLQGHLEVLNVDTAAAWSDTQIKPGSNWFQEIRRDLNEAKVIILLISADFLVSDFIRKVEIPLLLEEHEKKNDLIVVPFVVSPCPWHLLPWLKRYQVFPKDGTPLINYRPGKRDKIIVDLVETLYRFLYPGDRFLVSPARGRRDIPGDEYQRSLYRRLIDGSKKYYRVLTGENGRFRMLRIEDLILSRTDTKEHWLTQPVHGEDEVSNKDETVINLLPRLWEQSLKHAVIVGEGGMGKTVSMVRLWQILLEREANETDKPVPVFIALNEFNQVSEEKRRGFILNYIHENYCDSSTTIEEIWDAMKHPEKEGTLSIEEIWDTIKHPEKKGTFKPRIVLLLDGFNEITVEKRELLLEITRIMEKCPGTRLVLTSRYDMRGRYQWGNWNLVRLLKLEKTKVESYLQEKNLGIPGQARFLELMGNPMMLSLYAATCEVQNKNRESKHCRFKERVESAGELLWNFIEAQVGKLGERLAEDQGMVYYYKFLLKFFLPALGFEMEKSGRFDFTNAQINSHIDHISKRFSQADFFDTYPEFDEYVEYLPLGAYANESDRREGNAKLKKIFCEELHILVKEGESFRFIHLDFRDFFAAVHLLNESEISVGKGEIPGVFKERILDYFVRRLLGEIEGEHYSKPYLVMDEGWKIDINKGNRLHEALDLCRGKFGEEVGFAVWNILTIWKEVRGELSGADLSNLDLSGLPLNGVRCSRFYENRYLPAVFDGSRVHEKNLLPQGHFHWIYSAVYSPEGGEILSASEDKTIKEWDAATGQCIKTLAGHSLAVTSAVYSPDGNKILSTSQDQTIKEWDTETGVCVKTLAGHTGEVTGAVYRPDGKKILSASQDQTIKEWDVETGECVKTLAGHSSFVNSAVYSRDGKKILSASSDKTIKEWDVETGECVKTLTGHTMEVTAAVYSAGGKKILSASLDQTIKEWDTGTGECVNTLAGYTGIVTSAMYSPDGKKILSASRDKTIKEWDVVTGRCVKTLAGHTRIVTSAMYSPDGKKIISTSRDKTIKEWDAATGKCLKTHKKEDKPVIPGYPPNHKNIKLKTEENKIYVPNVSGQEERELINIPGLFIQGCSFQNLEKGSQWSKEGVEILRQYHARL
jgi:WD40 repeat protein